MNTMVFAASLLSRSLAWSLLYSIGQGLIIYGALILLLKALPDITARIKYALSLTAFFGVFVWFIDTWIGQYQRMKGFTVFVTTYADGSIQPQTYSLNTTAVSPLHGLQSYLAGLEKYFPLLISIYTAGLALMLFRFSINLINLGRLKKRNIMLPTPHFQNFLSSWQQRLAISRKVQLFFSEKVDVPAMLGFMKPVILLPIATVNHLTTEQLEAIILHELIHVKRMDYLANMIQAIVETILFFNPFIWLISRIVRREREHCCDDVVVACSADRLPYAKALAILEYKRSENESLTIAITGHKNQLFNRIKRIMEMKKSNVNYSRATIVTVAVIALVLTAAMFTFTPLLAQKVKNESGAGGGNSKTVTKTKTITIDENGKKKEVTKGSEAKDGTANGNNIDVDITVRDEDGAHAKTKVYKKTISIDTSGLSNVITNMSLASGDVAEAMAEVRKEIGAIDWHKIKDDIDEAMAEVDRELNSGKLNKEINIEVKKELEKAKKEMEAAKKEMKTRKQAYAYAYSDGAEAQAGSGGTDYEAMLNKMEKQRLIDRSRSYTIEKAGSELYINDKKQPDEVFEQYRDYLNYKNVTIKGNKGSLEININN